MPAQMEWSSHRITKHGYTARIGGGTSMAIRSFVESAGRRSGTVYRGMDRIPGTNKVRTYCVNAGLYSSESDFKKVISKRQHTVGIKKKI